MGARVNTATIWMESSQRWRINVQKDGVRRSFYSSKPGRNGQREANRKADAWLDDGIEDQRVKVGAAYLKFLEGKRQTTSRSNWAPMMSRWTNHISSVIARKQVSALTEQDLQDVLDRAYARSKLTRKTLMSLQTDLYSFMKYCRKARLTTLFPESGRPDHSNSGGPGRKDGTAATGLCGTVQQRSYQVLWKSGTG